MWTNLIRKCLNREIIAYFITGVMTTLVDWVSYTAMSYAGVHYIPATVLSWAAAVLFAYVTNKFFVFRSMNLMPAAVVKEFIAFVSCRLATGLATLIAMMILIDGLHISHDVLCKIFVSVISLVLNYVLSKLLIFK